EYCTAVDRNHDGYIHTSFGLTNLLHWDRDFSGTNDPGGVSAAEDECIINYTRVVCNTTRLIAIDANNDVWVGGTGNSGAHEKLSGVTGQPITNTAVYLSGAGYGGLVDGHGVLWSSASLTRFDPAL